MTASTLPTPRIMTRNEITEMRRMRATTASLAGSAASVSVGAGVGWVWLMGFAATAGGAA